MFETDTAVWFPPDFEFGSWFVVINLSGEGAPHVTVNGEPDDGGIITLQTSSDHVHLSAAQARDLAKALIFAADNASGDRVGELAATPSEAEGT